MRKNRVFFKYIIGLVRPKKNNTLVSQNAGNEKNIGRGDRKIFFNQVS